MIDFDVPEELKALGEEVRAFVANEIVPFEQDCRLTQHGPTDALRQELVGLAREAGEQ